MNTSRQVSHVVAMIALLAVAVARAEDVATVWDIAKPRAAMPGAPRSGDVTVRNLHPHPGHRKQVDAHDTLQMIRDFHVTRLEWTYGLDAEFVRKLKAMGLTVGGAIEDDPGSRTKLGRVIGKEGQFVTHRWFPKDRLVGCANAPEFRAAWLAEAKRNIDAGVDLIQQDDPQMAARTNPPFCYCRYCQTAFAGYQQQHGVEASYEQFQRDSIVAFHREMHRQLDAYAGRHIPFSHNSGLGFQGKVDWTAAAFDFINGEIENRMAHPARFLAAVAAAGNVPIVLSYRDTSVQNNRRLLALACAAGAWLMLPWDVYMPNRAAVLRQAGGVRRLVGVHPRQRPLSRRL